MIKWFPKNSFAFVTFMSLLEWTLFSLHFLMNFSQILFLISEEIVLLSHAESLHPLFWHWVRVCEKIISKINIIDRCEWTRRSHVLSITDYSHFESYFTVFTITEEKEHRRCLSQTKIFFELSSECRQNTWRALCKYFLIRVVGQIHRYFSLF